MKNRLKMLFVLALAAMLLPLPVRADVLVDSQGDAWHFGFGQCDIVPDQTGSDPLYIAGYNSGLEITGVLDLCQARAVWLDAGGDGVLLIGVDCVALASGTVEQIRAALADIPGCAAINVYATHTHAGIDTLGLWGPVGVDGKNDAYMASLVSAAEKAGRDAAASRRDGRMYYGVAQTQNMYRDSRDPIVFDANLYCLRMETADGGKGLRMYFYGAHAESLRGDNRLLSRDFAGLLCDGMTEITGDDTLFLPGAIGGLIMTKAFVADTGKHAVENLHITAEKLLDYAQTITPDKEREIAPVMTSARQRFTVPMDNSGFLLFKFLGILDNKAVPGESATGYLVETEMNLLQLGDITLALIPGELFPELVTGEAYGDANPNGVNPRPFADIAASYGRENLLIVGLANDEVGYIVPPSDFLLSEEAPYLARTKDYKGEDHYEETNSVGPECAGAIADAFEALLQEMQ